MANVTEAGNVQLNTLKQLQSGGGVAGKEKQDVGGPSFGDILKESVNSAIGAQHKSEQVSAKALVGKADMTEVLQAVTDAEMALNTVLAVRDRVVQAYEQVMRTPI